MSSSTKEIGAGKILLRGWTKRCPVCGETKIFRGWFELVEQCPRCHFWFERQEGQFIGAVGVNTVVTFVSMTVQSITVIRRIGRLLNLVAMSRVLPCNICLKTIEPSRNYTIGIIGGCLCY